MEKQIRPSRITKQSIIGCLLGTAVGDSMGLPFEGLSPGRGRRLFGPPDRHHLLFGRGMISDDTEHTCFVAKALIDSCLDPALFSRLLARSLRWWLVLLPAGAGFATLRSILKLWIGFSPDRSGVFSAGNGPAMRSPLLGLVFADHPEMAEDFVRRATRITHSDPKAFQGAAAAALAAQMAVRSARTSPNEYLQALQHLLDAEPSDELVSLVAQACRSAEQGEPTTAFAEGIGCRKGISGYMLHTLPCVIQTWLRHQEDFQGGVGEIIAAGGDTDTTGAILGAIIGARVGKGGIPAAWLHRITEWPRTVPWMERLGNALWESLTRDAKPRSPRFFAPGLIIRNLAFLLIVMAHGLRRLAPPY